ncbi:MAG TPA: FkbM family methyltransferase [Candidatus Cloacimonadota bacterium]|nr:FkbM family methyltransferase [Candidatus Cloacimonadota bacterium]
MEKDGELCIQKLIIEELLSDKSDNENIVVFDVGANKGKWAISFLDIVSLSKSCSLELHAFEPYTKAFQILKNNIKTHPLAAKVNLVQKACSVEPGNSKLFVNTEKDGSSSLHESINYNGKFSITSEIVETITLDDYCNEKKISKIHFIKCDTEGHEVAVISGSDRLFKEGKILLFQFEYNHTWVFSKKFLKDVFDFLTGMPYMVGKVTSEKVILYRWWHPELERFFESNYLIIHENALGLFKNKCEYYN